MSGDKLRSPWAPIKSDAANVEVVEAVNGLGWRVEGLADRFDTFHSELSLMRGMLGDLVPRVTSVEKDVDEVEKTTVKLSLGEKVGAVGAKVGAGTAVTVRYGAYISLALVVLNQLVKKFPDLQVVADFLKGLTAL